MQEAVTKGPTAGRGPETWRLCLGVAGCVVLAGIGGAFLPALPILLGVLVVVAVAVHVSSPVLRPWADRILRVPIARARRRYTHLAIAAGTGVLLVAIGAVGATLRGRIRTEAELRSQQSEAGAARVAGLLAQAQQLVASGDLPGAELVLLEADGIDGLDDATRDEVDEMLGRVQLCSDRDAILAILVALPADDFAGLEKGTAVPEALELGEQALTYRAVETARAQLGEAQRRRRQH